MPVPIPWGGGGGGISTCSCLVHVRILSSLSLVQIGGKTQDASFPCLFWFLVYFLFRFVSVYKYVSLFVFFLNSSFSSWLVQRTHHPCASVPFHVTHRSWRSVAWRAKSDWGHALRSRRLPGDAGGGEEVERREKEPFFLYLLLSVQLLRKKTCCARIIFRSQYMT